MDAQPDIDQTLIDSALNRSWVGDVVPPWWDSVDLTGMMWGWEVVVALVEQGWTGPGIAGLPRALSAGEDPNTVMPLVWGANQFVGLVGAAVASRCVAAGLSLREVRAMVATGSLPDAATLDALAALRGPGA